MAINDQGDPTRGTGPDKVTEANEPGLDAPPHAHDNEAPGSGAADPARGGCMKLGWGCLPVLLGAMLIPAGLFF
jgi:hypothetical protein